MTLASCPLGLVTAHGTSTRLGTSPLAAAGEEGTHKRKAEKIYGFYFKISNILQLQNVPYHISFRANIMLFYHFYGPPSILQHSYKETKGSQMSIRVQSRVQWLITVIYPGLDILNKLWRSDPLHIMHCVNVSHLVVQLPAIMWTLFGQYRR